MPPGASTWEASGSACIHTAAAVVSQRSTTLWYRWTPQIEFQWRREVRNHVDAKQLEFALLCRTTAPLLPFIRALTKEGGVTDVSKPFAGFIR